MGKTFALRLILLPFLALAAVTSPVNVGTVANLKALTPGSAASINLQGYYTSGDGGGGPLYWDGTSAATPDSCTVYKPSSNPTRGRWFRIIQGPLNAKACGMKMDGVTDDATRLQAAINYSSSSGGREILMPPGTAYVGSQIEIKTESVLQGSGDTLSIIKTALTDTLFHVAQAVSNASISKLGIFVTVNATGCKAFAIEGTRIRISDVTLKNTWVGIWGTKTSQYVTVENYRQFSDSGISAYGMHLMGVKDWMIKDVEISGKNYLHTGIDKGISLDNGRTIYGCKNVRILGARISRMRAYGMGGDPDDVNPDYPTSSTAVSTWTEEFQDSLYTSPVPSDIGKNVIQGGTVRGTLLAYDSIYYDILNGDTAYHEIAKHPRRWCINRTGTMSANTATTLSGGTGAGRTLVNNYQYKAPTATDNVWQNINADRSFSFLIGVGITLDATFNTHLDGFACDSNRRAGVSTGDNLSIGATIANGSSSRGMYGLIAQTPSKTTISNCALYENLLSGIHTENTANGLSDTTNYFTISNCKIYRNGKAHSNTEDAAIAGLFNYAIIANNQIFENYYAGIILNGSKNRIVGNLIADNGWSDTVGPSGAATGLYIESGSNNLIDLNWVGNRLATNYQGWGLFIGANGNDNVVRNNYLVGNATGAYSDASGGLRNQDFDNQKTSDATTIANGTGITARTQSAHLYSPRLVSYGAVPPVTVDDSSTTGGQSAVVFGAPNTDAGEEPRMRALGVFNRHHDFSTDLVYISDTSSGATNSANGSYLGIKSGGNYVFRVQPNTTTIKNGVLTTPDIGAATGTSVALTNTGNAANTLANLFNASTGASAITVFRVGQSGSLYTSFQYQGSGFTTSGNLVANQGVLYMPAGATGGLLVRLDADAPIIFSPNNTEILKLLSGVVTMTGQLKYAATNTTGAGSAALGGNSPAVTNTAPYTWFRVTTSDGSTGYIPVWK